MSRMGQRDQSINDGDYRTRPQNLEGNPLQTVHTDFGNILLTVKLKSGVNVLYDRPTSDTRCYFNVQSKADTSQLNLYRTEQQLKTGKNRKSKK